MTGVEVFVGNGVDLARCTVAGIVDAACVDAVCCASLGAPHATSNSKSKMKVAIRVVFIMHLIVLAPSGTWGVIYRRLLMTDGM